MRIAVPPGAESEKIPYLATDLLTPDNPSQTMLRTLLFCLATLLCTGCRDNARRQLRVFQLNIWHDATAVPGAFEALVDEIDRLDADLVALCEASNKNGSTAERLAEALNARGKRQWYAAAGHYTGVQSTDVCVLSRHPIEQTTGLARIPGGVDMKVRIDVEGHSVLLYPAHLDYTHYACYLPRGYDGATWQRLAAPCADSAAVMRMNRRSTRDEAVAHFIEEAAGERADLVLLAGDFNEPSHLDWTAATADLWDHRGCVIPWDCSTALYRAGFRDVYRELHPDPTTHPGFTYPSDNPDKEPESLTWAPEADERDRIDFIYYLPGGAFAPVRVEIVGPASSIVRSRRTPETGEDRFIEPLGTWPTDHKGILATFELR